MHILTGNGSTKVAVLVASVKEQFSGSEKDWIITEGINLLIKRAGKEEVEKLAGLPKASQWNALRKLAATYKVGFTRSYKKTLLRNNAPPAARVTSSMWHQLHL